MYGIVIKYFMESGIISDIFILFLMEESSMHAWLCNSPLIRGVSRGGHGGHASFQTFGECFFSKDFTLLRCSFSV